MILVAVLVVFVTLTLKHVLQFLEPFEDDQDQDEDPMTDSSDEDDFNDCIEEVETTLTTTKTPTPTPTPTPTTSTPTPSSITREPSPSPIETQSPPTTRTPPPSPTKTPTVSKTRTPPRSTPASTASSNRTFRWSSEKVDPTRPWWDDYWTEDANEPRAPPTTFSSRGKGRGRGRGMLSTMSINAAPTMAARGRARKVNVTLGPYPPAKTPNVTSAVGPNPTAHNQRRFVPSHPLFPENFNAVVLVKTAMTRMQNLLEFNIYGNQVDHMVTALTKITEEVDLIQRQLNTTAQTMLRAANQRDKVSKARCMVFASCVKMKDVSNKEISRITRGSRTTVLAQEVQYVRHAGTDFLNNVNKMLAMTTSDIN